MSVWLLYIKTSFDHAIMYKNRLLCIITNYVNEPWHIHISCVFIATSQMLRRAECNLPAKFWRLVGCPRMISILLKLSWTVATLSYMRSSLSQLPVFGLWDKIKWPGHRRLLGSSCSSHLLLNSQKTWMSQLPLACTVQSSHSGSQHKTGSPALSR